MNIQKAKTVVLAEDKAGTRRILRRFLEDMGFRVVVGGDGAEAVNLFYENTPDLVVMDIDMPVLDGLEACAQMKRLPGGDTVPVLLVTGLGDESLVKRAFMAGASDFIAKPINWEEFGYRIEKMLYLKDMEETLRLQSFYDSLTGLPNKTLFLDRLSVGLNQAALEQSSIAVMVLNLRGFRILNEAFGYQIGDTLIKGVGVRLLELLPHSATVARLKGDSFGVFLRCSSEKEAAKVAKTLIDGLRKSWAIKEQEIVINSSVGIALFPNDGPDSLTLLRNAETAMQQGRSSYLASYFFYNSQLNARAYERLAMETDLHQALDRGEFELYYQPQVNTTTGEIIAVEALTRWNRGDLGIVSPSVFIPIAEESGLIISLGEWVMERICLDMKRWRNSGIPAMPVSFNISAVELAKTVFLKRLVGICAERGVSVRDLKIEIKESAASTGLASTLELIRQIQAQGMRVSIDDFGTGYASLNTLRHFRVDEIKVERKFIQNITGSLKDRAIVESFIFLSERIGVDLVAEGVETYEQLELLRSFGCKYAQGYVYSRPIPSSAIDDLLRQGQIMLEEETP